MTPMPLSQRDPRWSNLTLGQGNRTIGQAGCFITCIAMKYGLTPDIVNELFIASGAYASEDPNNPYANKDIVDWTKIGQAIKGATFLNKSSSYNNDETKANLPCLVEVNGAPIGGTLHAVLYIGNQQLIDPWDGKVKPTSTYQPYCEVVLGGQYMGQPQTATVASTLQGNYYKGLDLSNTDSVKAAIDTWADVVAGKYVPKDVYDKLQSTVGTNQEALTNYAGMVALGYTTAQDITNTLEKANEKILKLLRDTSVLEKSNFQLAKTIQDQSYNNYTAIDEALNTVDENKQLKEGVSQIAQEVGADKPSIKDILSKVFSLKDITQRLTSEKQSEVDSQAIQTTPDKTFTTSDLMSLFKLVPSKEVSNNG